MNKGNGMKRTYIIRWSDLVRFPSGGVSNMSCHPGPEAEAREYAERIAREQGVEVELVD